MEINTKENGERESQMVLGLLQAMATPMKDSSSNRLKMASECKNLQMEISIGAIT